MPMFHDSTAPPPDLLGGDFLPGGYPFRPCTPMVLPDHLLIDAARLACEINLAPESRREP
jgi:hypothetical protein